MPPATVAPAQTSQQQQDDQRFASHLSSSPSLRNAEAAQVPAPGFSTAWRPLPVVNTPDQWVESFVEQLLTINFAAQPRTGLGPWLSAEEAPERLPGVPLSAGSKVLYLSLLDPTAVGAGSSPIPGAAAWQADARAGVSWKVSDLGVRPDAQWSQLVASGWQPTDERFAAYQVTGRLNVTQRGSSAVSLQGFSMVVYVGSARWHPGYGTVSITGWKET